MPDPPDFTECVDAKKQQPVPPGAPKPTDDDLKNQCEQEFDSLKQQVMQFLISAEWIQQEADARDIEVSDEEVQKQFDDQKKQSFPNDKQYQQFLKTSGQTEEDLLFRVKLDVLSTKVRDEIIEDTDEVSDEDIETYYDENKERFAQPERRDLNVVLTKTEAKATRRSRRSSRARASRTSRRSSRSTRRPSHRAASCPAVAEGQQEKAFDDAIFAADKGELTGPVKTAVRLVRLRGHRRHAGVAAVARRARRRRSRACSGRSASRRRSTASSRTSRTKYTDETHCADDYVVQECENA